MFNDWVDEVDGSFPLCKLTTPRYMEIRGFQKKDARFLKIKNIANLLSDNLEGKIKKNIDF